MSGSARDAGGPPAGADRAAPADAPFDPRAIRGVTFDFGDTLVVVRREDFQAVVAGMAADACAHLRLGDPADFLEAWGEERDRQMTEDVAAGPEMDLGRRVARTAARMRGLASPPPGLPWDRVAVDAVVDPSEIAWTLDRYRDRWVAGIPVAPGVASVLERLAVHRRLGILSNWPHAATLRAQVVAAGWAPFLWAVVVSVEVGAIKPAPEMFRAAEAALGWPAAPPGSILHVGDDRQADVAGARRAGWRAAWLRRDNPGSPLPGAGRPPEAGDPGPDIEIDTLEELIDILAEPPADD
jgi:HAD superfamily hydrolase (TIGR01549 family)